MSDVYVRTLATMGTIASCRIVRRAPRAADLREIEAAVDRAIDWFGRVESACSRFDATSDVRRLAEIVGAPVEVSPILCEAAQFALAVAEESGGAFDPTIGADLETMGFDREYRTGAIVKSGVAPDRAVSYRDVHVDAARRTVTLQRRLLLDLGGVAKGLAIDLAARELAAFEHFAIEAGGDLYLAGHNADDEPWAIGIRHPRDPDALLETLRVSNAAVCTSGDYERRVAQGHHLIDPRTRQSAGALASVTVVAPTAMVADALGTAAFVLGPIDGVRFLERHGVEGFAVTPALDRISTGPRAQILSHA